MNRYQCLTCTEEFSTKSHLIEHILSNCFEASSSDDDCFPKCEYCNRSFANINNMMIHVKIHMIRNCPLPKDNMK